MQQSYFIGNLYFAGGAKMFILEVVNKTIFDFQNELQENDIFILVKHTINIIELVKQEQHWAEEHAEQQQQVKEN